MKIKVYIFTSLTLLALLFLCANNSDAQTTTVSVAFDVDSPVATITPFAKEIRYDGTLQTAPITCIANGAAASICSSVLPNTFLTGVHNVALKLINGSQAAETTFTGVNSGNIPKNASTIKVTVTTTVTVTN